MKKLILRRAVASAFVLISLAQPLAIAEVDIAMSSDHSEAPVSKDYTDLTTKELAKGMVNNYINQFENSHFNEAISLGNRTTFSNALDGIDVEHDPDLNSGRDEGDKVEALYYPSFLYLDPVMKFEKDISVPSNYENYGIMQTLWHETIHRLEDINDDFESPNADDKAYQERNVEYMQNVVMAIKYLESLEKKAAAGATDAELEAVWDTMLKRYEEAMNIMSAAKFKPDLDKLKEWTGWDVNPEKVLDHYASGAATDRLRDFAKYYKTKHGGGAKSSGVFPVSGDFNGMIIDYSISGVDATTMEDVGGFMTSRALDGYISGNQVTISGTASMGGGYGANLTVTVQTSTDTKEYKSYIKSGYPGFNKDSFNITLPITSKDKYVNVSIRMDGEYSMGGGWRGLMVSGSFESKNVIDNTRPDVIPPDQRRYPIGIPGLDFANNPPPALYANREIKLPIGSLKPTINGIEVETDQPAFISGGRTFIPLRFVAESIGAQVDYIPNFEGWKAIVISGAQDYREDYIVLFLGSKTAYHNGVEKTLDVAPFAANGRTFVPLRFIAETLGAEVGWDQPTFTATVKK